MQYITAIKTLNICQFLIIYLCQLRAIFWHINLKSRQVNNMYVYNSHKDQHASTAQNNITASYRNCVKPLQDFGYQAE